MITITMSKACKNCQYWGKYSSDHNPNIGKCEIGNGELNPEDECEPNLSTGFVASTIYEGYAELITGPDFYCCHYSEKTKP